METDVEGLEEDGRRGGGEEGRAEEGEGFGGVGDGGLFEEDVLPRAEGFEGPFGVEAVGEGDVDRGDGGVVYQSCAELSLAGHSFIAPLLDRGKTRRETLVRPMHDGNAMLLSKSLCLLLVPRSDCCHDDLRMGSRRYNDCHWPARSSQVSSAPY